MAEPVTWSDLHDAVLQKLTVVWETGIVEITLSSFFASTFTIAAESVVVLTLPRQHPWGASMYVNEARLTPTTAGIGQLEIEMQSGDRIIIQAAAFSLTAAP